MFPLKKNFKQCQLCKSIIVNWGRNTALVFLKEIYYIVFMKHFKYHKLT